MVRTILFLGFGIFYFFCLFWVECYADEIVCGLVTFKYGKDSVFQVGSRLVGLAHPQRSRHSVDPRRFRAPTRRSRPFPFREKKERRMRECEIAVCATGLPRSRGLCSVVMLSWMCLNEFI